ncbi:ras GEF [Rhizopus microsporus var. microsporus]|nr:ras GEF [Rhizopus microsporus var. microsporus]
MTPRRSSSPSIVVNSSKPFSSYTNNQEIFLLATTRIHTRVRAKTFTDLSSDDVPLIPQPPFDFINQSLQHQQEFSPSFEKLRTLQSINILSILQFHPMMTAYQLTLIESAIFRNVTTTALLNHTPKSPDPCIVASTDFFNYLTRLIEYSILIKLEASDRSQHLNYWIKVAGKCYELKNYQTLKAVISALGTPPMQRLKRSWAFVPKKAISLLEELVELMSETSNYEKYRRVMLEDIKLHEPMIPFLGTFIHDMTYLNALNNQQDARLTDLLSLFTDMQKNPDYSPALPAMYTKEVISYNRPKFSIRTTASTRKGVYDDELAKINMDMQQCLVTQYLLTRPWVNEKTVDELCVLREPTKANGGICLTSSVSLTTTRSSSGSLTSSSTSPSRPLSLEDEEDYFERKSSAGFWLFGRKSVDQSTAFKPVESFATLHRSPRHFSFDEVNTDNDENVCIKKRYHGTVTSQSSSSLAIFRKDFWKNNSNTNGSSASNGSNKFSIISFNSEPSISSVTHNTASPHPLDNSQSDTSSSFVWT